MIEAAGVTKRYGAVTAINNVSFRVAQGEIFGLLGPNGAGKTTMIRMLTALTVPDKGVCRIGGFTVPDHPFEIKKRIGVVPQENNLDRELTAYENLLIYALLHRVADRQRKIDETLDMVGLKDRRDSLVDRFSGGMKRRLLMARALLPEPSVLFLDEPSIGLDPQIRHHLWDIVRKAKLEGRTVFLTTHYIEEAEALCDRVGILAGGALIALDSPERLKATVGEYVVEFVDSGGKLISTIVKDRDEAYKTAAPAECGVTIRKSNLEDVYMNLTGERM